MSTNPHIIRRVPALIFVLVGLLGLTITTATGVQALFFRPDAVETDPLPERTIPHTDVNPYGANFFLEWEVETWKIDKTFQMAEEAGIHWVKQQFPWEDIQLKPGQEGFWDDRLNKSTWEKYDRIVELALRHGLELIVRLDRPPAWTRQDNRHPEAPPDDFEDYGDFVYEVVQRYRGKVRYYQIWNEPNIYPEWGERPVNAAEYVRLLEIAYRRAKEADPNVVILSAPLAQTLENNPRNQSDLLYLEEMYRHGAKEYFDVLFANAYGFALPPDDPPDPNRLNFTRVVLLREIMERYGDGDKAVWFNEFGWNAAPADFPTDRLRWSRVSEELQAEYTASAIAKAREEWPWAGVFCIWYFRHSGHISPDRPEYYFRMVDPGFTPRPIYHTIKRVTQGIAVARNGTYEESNPALVASGQWQARLDASAQGGEYLVSRQAGDNLTITFEGSGIQLLMRRGPDAGVAHLTVDGGEANLLPHDRQGRSLLDLRGPSTALEWIPVAAGLPPGRHTLRIVVTAAEGDLREVAVDGFRVDVNGHDYRTQQVRLGLGVALTIGSGVGIWLRRRIR